MVLTQQCKIILSKKEILKKCHVSHYLLKWIYCRALQIWYAMESRSKKKLVFLSPFLSEKNPLHPDILRLDFFQKANLRVKVSAKQSSIRKKSLEHGCADDIPLKLIIWGCPSNAFKNSTSIARSTTPDKNSLLRSSNADGAFSIVALLNFLITYRGCPSRLVRLLTNSNLQWLSSSVMLRGKTCVFTFAGDVELGVSSFRRRTVSTSCTIEDPPVPRIAPSGSHSWEQKYCETTRKFKETTPGEKLIWWVNSLVPGDEITIMVAGLYKRHRKERRDVCTEFVVCTSHFLWMNSVRAHHSTYLYEWTSVLPMELLMVYSVSLARKRNRWIVQ